MPPHMTRLPSVTPPTGSDRSMAPAVDPLALDTLASGLDSTPAAVTPSTIPVDNLALYAGTVEELRENFDSAIAAHPDLDITWDQIHEAVVVYVNESARATTDEGRLAASRVLATLLANVTAGGASTATPTQSAATTADAGSLPTGGAFQTGTDQAQLWSGGDPMKQEALASGDALESTFGGALFDGIRELKLEDGTAPDTGSIWDAMSASLAAGMTGHVTINMMFGLRPGSVFERIESKEIAPLMEGDAPVVTKLTVKRFLRSRKGVDADGKAYTDSVAGAELFEEIECDTVERALSIDTYRWEREDGSNPYFAVMGGHTTGAPPAYDATTSATPDSNKWGYRHGLEEDGLTPEW